MPSVAARLWWLSAALAGPMATAVLAKGGPPEIKPSTPTWAILCTLVALGGICVVAFKNAKRTHLD